MDKVVRLADLHIIQELTVDLGGCLLMLYCIMLHLREQMEKNATVFPFSVLIFCPYFFLTFKVGGLYAIKKLTTSELNIK